MIQGWREARRLGHDWVGEEHVLLALAGSDSVAGDALREAGATVDVLDGGLLTALAHADPPVESDERGPVSPRPNPRHYSLFGRAEGLALARGSRSLLPEDVLVAAVWRDGMASRILDQLGIDRTDLIRRLAERGADVPSGEPEPLDRRPRKRVDVPFDELMTIVRELPARLPEGSPFGFNLHHNTQRAWVVVREDVDAEPLIAEIVAGR
jgi:ATP-dependent Clp protease ATP-binding subunit ClpA